MAHQTSPTLKFVSLRESSPLPTRAHANDAGLDLRADHPHAAVVLEQGQRRLVPTGIAMQIPAGYVGLVTPRSGMAHKQGATVLNAPGIVDAGYTGEVFVNLINLGDGPLAISHSDRIAQLVITPIITPELEEVASLDETARGDSGHGSTGKK